MEYREKDKWDKASIILQFVGGLLTALTIAAFGFFGSRVLTNRQDHETNVRLYSELMSRREEAESNLRKDMFVSIIQNFLAPNKTTPLKPKEKLLNLELLAYNFHESLNLKPLFIDLEKELTVSKDKDSDKKEYLDRLDKIARDITRKQMLVLEEDGQKFEKTINLDSLRINLGSIQQDDTDLTLENIKRKFQISGLEADSTTKEVKVRLVVRTYKAQTDSLPDENKVNTYEFWVGFFDFPMIDNTRLSNNQRCAIIMNQFENSSAQINLVYFPGSHASLKEKPYYEEVIQNLNKFQKPNK